MTFPDEGKMFYAGRLQAKICCSLENQRFEGDNDMIEQPDGKGKLQNLHWIAVERSARRGRRNMERQVIELLVWFSEKWFLPSRIAA